MATIKRNGNLIITKGGKVSCTCCGEECCMYPFQGIQDGLYSFDDLPDQINLSLDFVGASPVYFKLAAPTQSIWGTAYYIGSNSAPIGSGDEDVILGPPEQDAWVRTLGGYGSGGPGLCLINYNEELGPTCVNDCYSDNFADTYTITTSFSSGTVTRQGLCLWNGVDGNGCPLQLIYGGFGGDPETEPAESGLKWSVSFLKFEFLTCIESFGRLKSGSQNSPIGTYDISYASEGPESATVS